MINHHPSEQVLTSFAAAELPTSVSVAVAIHIEMCPHCQEKVNNLTSKLADKSLSDDVINEGIDMDLEAMMNDITADEGKDYYPPVAQSHQDLNGKKITYPAALKQLSVTNWQSVGKLARSRVQLDDGPLRSSIYHIDAGGDIPQHTHNGFEVTVLLDGSFDDEFGTYQKGDFIWLDSEHNHNPITKEGCVCYAVVSDSLHFTQGVSRLLNPIGKLIY
jgi:putative transcriptional regulator